MLTLLHENDTKCSVSHVMTSILYSVQFNHRTFTSDECDGSFFGTVAHVNEYNLD